MTMISKIADRHLSRQACIYIRQSTLAQVRSNQESTDRQYNLLNKARSLGWNPEQIRILDRDLGQSGAAATKRADFKTLVSDVAMGQIGARPGGLPARTIEPGLATVAFVMRASCRRRPCYSAPAPARR